MEAIPLMGLAFVYDSPVFDVSDAYFGREIVRKPVG